MSDNEYYTVLKALSEIYISIHVFDIEANVLMPFKTNKFIDMWSEGFDTAQDKVINVMKNITKLEHIDTMLEFVDFTTLPERLIDRNNVSIVFEGKVNGWCRARFIVIDRDDNGKPQKLVYAVECIDEEKKRENHLLYLANTDLLTGISNRGSGQKQISDYLATGMCGLFCLFDVDKFKKFNDKYSHRMGDEVLIRIAEAMTKVKNENDVVMRLGGDEFAAYFVGIKDRKTAEGVIRKLFDEIDKIILDGVEERIGVSLGACISTKNMDFDEIYKIADSGVYKSKVRKGSSFVWPDK